MPPSPTPSTLKWDEVQRTRKGTASPASSASVLSSSASCSSLSSSSTRSTYSDASTSSAPLRLRLDPALRPNEHLAVLLPRQLWKSDSHASHCDNFYCRVPFSIFERRHHCRKCGGVFCQPCSARTTALLDASALPFLHPPRNIPLAAYASPSSPILDARVCDDCYDQVHGLRTPASELPPLRRRPVSRANSLLSSPIALFTSPASAPSSAASSPPLATPPLPSNLSRTRPSSPRHPPRTSLPSRPASSASSATARVKEERSYGELDAYPLRRASLLCKAAGGGRWEPAPFEPDPTLRVPLIGGKAPFEELMEREEEEERRRRRNPIVRDGDFQYRFPAQDAEPVVLERPPLHRSTF
ncbi:FYVE zinc finger-domain-containing protein [Mycena maculata]|uniref:FYVE zinc finger-domain-containing protein n=1 Tax=Mycena maculata TaxID=230809 RepID=A0AAD7MNH8_9AGAR|nr:FYVE zinc finger-domain-containing protein [Mycena maculata]